MVKYYIILLVKGVTSMAKNIPETQKSEISRENLIVPEEIFKDELPEQALGAEIEEELSKIIESEILSNDFDKKEQESAPEDGEFEQIAFFDDDTSDGDYVRLDNGQSEDEAKFEKDEDGYDEKKPRTIDKLFDFVELITFTVVAVFILTTVLFKHAVVDGPSMEGTLFDGEHLIVSDLFYSPKAGDVIVFEDFTLADELKKPIVKRVVATGGDTVMITDDGTVYVNGKPFNDKYKYVSGGAYINYSTNTYAQNKEYKVPEGHIFVLGDNRNDSTDSRFFGAISENTVLGEVKFRIFPFDVFGIIE